MGIVYKLEFASGKSYIGITKRTLRSRIAGHRFAAENGSPYLVHKAWRLHGEPLVWTVAWIPDEELAEAEAEFIRIFKTEVPNGYNLTPGGEYGPRLKSNKTARSKEHRERMSELMRRLPRNPEWCRRISESKFGKPRSAETRAKLSKANQGKTFPGRGKNRKQTEETKAKISAKMKGVQKSPEVRARMSAAQQRFRAAKRLLEP